MGATVNNSIKDAIKRKQVTIKAATERTDRNLFNILANQLPHAEKNNLLHHIARFSNLNSANNAELTHGVEFEKERCVRTG